MGNSQQQSYIYSEPMKNSKQPGFSSIYRNPRYDQLIVTNDPKIQTLQDFCSLKFQKSFPEQKCLGIIVSKPNQQERTIQYWTYREIFEKAHCLGSSFENLKLWSSAEDTSLTRGKPMKLLGILSKNCREWTLTDIGCAIFGITTVPLYETLGIQNLSYCLKQTNMTSCVVSEKTAQMLFNLKDTGRLKNLLLTEKISVELFQKLKSKYQLYFIDDLIKLGETKKLDFHKFPVYPEDCYTFSYTSGTTGPPKGAMIKHQNIISLLSSLQNSQVQSKPTDVYLSFLPLPHLMQRSIFLILFDRGSSITFFGGDLTKIKEDAQLVKPTIFAAVPRLYNRMYDAFNAKLQQASCFSKFMFDRGYSAKKQRLTESGETNHFLYDSLVFSTPKAAFGGRIRMLISGSAPIKQEVQQFLKIVFSAKFHQAYGQTQNSGAAFVTRALQTNAGHVGGILSGLEFKLSDIPEMQYTSNDRNQLNQSTPKGEIWLRGPQVFLGYYKDPQKTKEALTQDGWLKTGDVGMLLPYSNALKIIDRKKNIFKLQQGEYVASQKVQAIYLDHPIINEIFFYGSLQQPRKT